MPAGTSFGSDAGTQGRQLEPRRILQPHTCKRRRRGSPPRLVLGAAERLPGRRALTSRRTSHPRVLPSRRGTHDPSNGTLQGLFRSLLITRSTRFSTLNDAIRTTNLLSNGQLSLTTLRRLLGPWVAWMTQQDEGARKRLPFTVLSSADRAGGLADLRPQTGARSGGRGRDADGPRESRL